MANRRLLGPGLVEPPPAGGARRAAHTTRPRSDAWPRPAHAYAERRAARGRRARRARRGGRPARDGINLWVDGRDERPALVTLAAQGIGVAPGTPFLVRAPEPRPRARHRRPGARRLRRAGRPPGDRRLGQAGPRRRRAGPCRGPGPAHRLKSDRSAITTACCRQTSRARRGGPVRDRSGRATTCEQVADGREVDRDDVREQACARPCTAGPGASARRRR